MLCVMARVTSIDVDAIVYNHSYDRVTTTMMMMMMIAMMTKMNPQQLINACLLLRIPMCVLASQTNTNRDIRDMKEI